jgi:beta-hydroxylase
MFSILEPGAVIRKHRGVFKGCLRFHLGLQTPNSPECFININGDDYYWKNGEGVVLDDCFSHYVQNNTDKVRIILFCDFERRMKSKLGQKINSFVCKKIAPLTTRANDKIEKSSQN